MTRKKRNSKSKRNGYAALKRKCRSQNHKKRARDEKNFHLKLCFQNFKALTAKYKHPDGVDRTQDASQLPVVLSGYNPDAKDNTLEQHISYLEYWLEKSSKRRQLLVENLKSFRSDYKGLLEVQDCLRSSQQYKSTYKEVTLTWIPALHAYIKDARNAIIVHAHMDAEQRAIIAELKRRRQEWKTELFIQEMDNMVLGVSTELFGRRVWGELVD